ncbi:MAG: hypothetical protein QNJ90_11355 [Planctomycetota bacterium]|nr:hypothetical protein [Planctomycetota bacterium]
MSVSASSPVAALVRVAVYAGGLFLLGNVVLLWIPAEHADDIWFEHRRVEQVQIGMLVLMFGLLIETARSRPSTRPLSVLLAGLAVAAIAREHNNWFKDNIGSGVWQAVVAVVLVLTALTARRLGGDTRTALAHLTASPAFGWLASGAVVFLFGQVLDERPIWALLVGEPVPYSAQRMAEESMETAAYWLIACGLLEWRLSVRTRDRAA